MSEWKKVKFLHLFSEPTRNGIYKSKEFHGRGAKIINMGEVFAYSFIGNQEMSKVEINDKERKSFLVNNGDLLFARRSLVESGAGKCAIVNGIKEETTFESSIIRVRLNENYAIPLFYMYWMRSLAGRTAINGIVNGVNVKGIRATDLQNIEVDLPPLLIQVRIATILSRYDSLIENYQKQIKLLEEAAQRLYKEWFVDLRFPGHENTKIVDGVPEGWEKKAVSQLGDYLNGFAFKPSDWQTTGKPIIKIKEMGNGVGNDTPRNNGERVPAKYLVKSGDLLFSWSATLMVIVWSGDEGWLNQHLFKVTPSEGIGREFLLQSISNAIEEFQNLTTGSTMKHIQRNKLDQVFVNVPNDEIMKSYSNIAEKTREQILHLSSQIRLLTEARDRLLPKLMSGEIAV